MRCDWGKKLERDEEFLESIVSHLSVNVLSTLQECCVPGRLGVYCDCCSYYSFDSHNTKQSGELVCLVQELSSSQVLNVFW